MFKRFGIGVLVALVLALGVTGIVLAQDPTPPTDGFCPFGGTCGGYGYGMGGWGYQGTMLSTIAEALGMTADELYATLSDGQSITEIAAAQGVDLGDVVTALIAPRVEQMEQAVADGSLTQEQADRMIEAMAEHMQWQLGNPGLGFGGGYGGRSGGFGRGGCGMWGGGSRGGRWGSRGGGRWGTDSGSPRPFGAPQQTAPSTGTSL